MALGFWDLWFDSEFRQRSDINELRWREADMAGSVSTLEDQVQRLRVQLRDLSMTTVALVEMLSEAGFDPKELHRRVDAMMEESKPRVSDLITCVRCRRDVKRSSTLMTGDGPICDPACAP